MPPGSDPIDTTPPDDAAPTGRRAHAGSRRARRKERRASRSRLRRVLTRSGLALGLLIVVLVGSAVGYYVYRDNQIVRQNVPTITPVRGPAENILLIGSTSRCAASSIARYRSECQSGVTGVNSDVVLVAHLDPAKGTVSLLSIPRDTFVPGARSGPALCGTTSPLTPGTCANKIDAALVEGPGQLINAIQQDFGIPINHFVDLNFATFTNVVNALGGIKMYFPDRLFDASSFLKITSTGCLQLNGTQALALVRSRHLYYFTKGETPNYAAIQAATTPTGPWYTPDSGGTYDGTGDLGRIVRVHLFLKALAQQVAARGLGNPITDNNLIGAVAPNLHVDSGLSTLALAHLALDFKNANFASAPELTIPTVIDGQSYTYYGANYGDVIFPSEPQDQQVVDQFLGAAPTSVSPASITVSVIDGTNSPSATAATSSSLARLGYHIVPTTASRYVGPLSETVVLYRAGHLSQAQQVLRSLSGMVVLGEGAPAAGADVSVITGSNFSVAAPASSSPTSSTAAPGATTSPPTTNPNLSAPTPPTSAVPAWDPRSCPAA